MMLSSPTENTPATPLTSGDDHSNKPRYATTRHPTMEAITLGLFRFATEAQALERLEQVKHHFVLSKQQPENAVKSALLWIRGYAVTEAEEKQGYLGHFALITLSQTEAGKYTLTATRIESELKFHPQKKRTQSKHPNWGHPVLRSAQKGKRFPSADAAQAALMALHEEYPDVSIPGPGKLYVMVYRRQEKNAPSLEKWILGVEAVEGSDEVTLRAVPNIRTKKPDAPIPSSTQPPQEDTGTETTDKPGMFAARVEWQRKKKAGGKKKPVASAKKTEKAEDDA